MRRSAALVIVIVAIGVACGGRGGEGATAGSPPLTASGPPLPSPQPIDPNARGAAFLGALANHIQPRWAQFLEDCRLRLGADHPLNMASLTADVELVLASETGKLIAVTLLQGSGNSDFDRAALEIANELPPTRAPREHESDDGRVHVRWVFARDRRQAGPATATVMLIELPLVATVERLIARGVLARAAQRASARATDPERVAATELVMLAALREGLASSDGATRDAALEVIARAKLVALAPDVHRMIEAQGPLAIAASAALGDDRAVPLLVAGLEPAFEDQPQVALAKLAALAALDQRAAAAKAIRSALARPDRKRGFATAIAALAIVPDPARAQDLAKFLGRDAEIRQAVCAALPAAAPTRAATLIGRGLRDADARVRASCARAAARHEHPGAAVRLRVLARDRDEVVRASAVAALAALGLRTAGAQDRSPPVRAAAAAAASEAELRGLAADSDPEVRAAAVAALVEQTPDRARDLALAAARDPASSVRRAAVAGVDDDAVLERLAGDAHPEVATAALVRYAQRRGRTSVTTAFLDRLATAAPRSLERVRIARAWLLAR